MASNKNKGKNMEQFQEILRGIDLQGNTAWQNCLTDKKNIYIPTDMNDNRKHRWHYMVLQYG